MEGLILTSIEFVFSSRHTNNEETLVKIQTILNDNPGDLNLIIHLESNVGTTKRIQIKNKKIACSANFLNNLRMEFGESYVWIN